MLAARRCTGSLGLFAVLVGASLGGCPLRDPGAAARENAAPVAKVDDVLQVQAGDSVVLNAAQSWDPDGDELQFRWMQIAGPAAAEIEDANTTEPIITPDLAGQYEFELTVADQQHSTRATVVVQVFPENAETEADADTGLNDTPEAGGVSVAKAHTMLVAEVLHPAYKYARAQIVDASPRATTGTIRAFRRQTVNVFDETYTVQANSGYRVLYWSSESNKRVRVTANYRGRTRIKTVTAAWPPGNLTFTYTNGRLR